MVDRRRTSAGRVCRVFRLAVPALAGSDPGQIVHTYVPLSPSSIGLKRSKVWNGNRKSVRHPIVVSPPPTGYTHPTKAAPPAGCSVTVLARDSNTSTNSVRAICSAISTRWRLTGGQLQKTGGDAKRTRHCVADAAAQQAGRSDDNRHTTSSSDEHGGRLPPDARYVPQRPVAAALGHQTTTVRTFVRRCRRRLRRHEAVPTAAIRPERRLPQLQHGAVARQHVSGEPVRHEVAHTRRQRRTQRQNSPNHADQTQACRHYRDIRS